MKKTKFSKEFNFKLKNEMQNVTTQYEI